MTQLSSQLTARKLAEACLTELIWKTANIEIDGISRETVESVLNGVRPPVCPPRTVTTVINIDRTFHELFAYCDEPVSWALISHYNEPEKKSEFLTLLLAYYESNNRSELAQWLEDNCLTTRTGQPCPQTTAKRGYPRERDGPHYERSDHSSLYRPSP